MVVVSLIITIIATFIPREKSLMICVKFRYIFVCIIQIHLLQYYVNEVIGLIGSRNKWKFLDELKPKYKKKYLDHLYVSV